MNKPILAVNTVVIGLALALSAKAAHQMIDRPEQLIDQHSATESVEWMEAAAVEQDAQSDLEGVSKNVFDARPIPADRLNIRHVGPRFFPDPANALDLGRTN